MAYKHDDKSSGQLIRSADWNDMGHEIERLEADKVNRAGDTIKGDLTVSGKVQFGPLAVTGDANITGKAQFGPLTVSGDASITGKAQLGSLTVTGDASITGKAQLGSLAVTGNTSITGGMLQVGSFQLSGFTNADQDEWPNVVWYRELNKNWDEGLIKHSSAKGKFGRAGFGVHFHQAREFGLWSTGWDPLFAVEGGTGNAYIKGNLKITGSIIPAVGNTDNSGIMFPRDPFGGGGDAAWIRYHNYRGGEKGTLEIGISNEADDHIALNPSGNVGIGTYNPRTKLEVAGAVTLGNSDIYFSKTDHDYTGIGNTDGWAAIENARNYDALMILGRAHAGGKRIVKLWDYLEVNGDSVVNGLFYVNSPSGNRLIMQGDGNLVIYRSNGVAWWNTQTNVSDSRLKKNIHSIERPLEKLLSVKGISFSWAKEEWGSERELGVMADEVERVFPELVYSLDKKYKSVKYQGLIAVLIEAIKEQQAIIQQLGAEIQNLKGMLKLNPA